MRLNHLSTREQEIVSYIANEYSMQAIADELFISYHTVTSHRRNILAKMNVKNTAGMVRRAFELGILQVTGVAHAA